MDDEKKQAEDAFLRLTTQVAAAIIVTVKEAGVDAIGDLPPVVKSLPPDLQVAIRRYREILELWAGQLVDLPPEVAERLMSDSELLGMVRERVRGRRERNP